MIKKVEGPTFPLVEKTRYFSIVHCCLGMVERYWPEVWLHLQDPLLSIARKPVHTSILEHNR